MPSQSLLLGFLFGILYRFSGDLLGLIMTGNPEPVVILRVIGVCMVPGVAMVVVSSALQGAGDMKSPIYLTIGVNLSAIALGLVLVPGAGPFPALGLTGAALAEKTAPMGAVFSSFSDSWKSFR